MLRKDGKVMRFIYGAINLHYHIGLDWKMGRSTKLSVSSLRGVCVCFCFILKFGVLLLCCMSLWEASIWGC